MSKFVEFEALVTLCGISLGVKFF